MNIRESPCSVSWLLRTWFIADYELTDPSPSNNHQYFTMQPCQVCVAQCVRNQVGERILVHVQQETPTSSWHQLCTFWSHQYTGLEFVQHRARRYQAWQRGHREIFTRTGCLINKPCPEVTTTLQQTWRDMQWEFVSAKNILSLQRIYDFCKE